MEKEPSKFKVLLEQRGFLTVYQLAQYLKEDHPARAVSYPTIQRYIVKGYFRCTKVGGQYRVERPEIEWFIAYGTDGIEGARMPSHSIPVPETDTTSLVTIIRDHEDITDSQDPNK